MKIFLCIIMMCLMLGACSYLNKKVGLDDDNFVEECVEELIRAKTGLDIDLTPVSDR